MHLLDKENNVINIEEHLRQIAELGNPSYSSAFRKLQHMPMFVVIRDSACLTATCAAAYDLIRLLEIKIPEEPNRIEMITGTNPKNHQEVKPFKVIEFQVDDVAKQGLLHKLFIVSLPQPKEIQKRFPLYPPWLCYFSYPEMRRTLAIPEAKKDAK